MFMHNNNKNNSGSEDKKRNGILKLNVVNYGGVVDHDDTACRVSRSNWELTRPGGEK